jgi:indoleamine 2,3-dioxygenase
MSRVFSVTKTNGFLPRNDPLEHLPEQFSALELLLQRMPLKTATGENGLLYHGKLGEAVQKELPLFAVDDITDGELLMALFRDYTFLASAYLLEPCDLARRETGEFGETRGRDKLPAQIAVPLCKVAEKISAKPFMEYHQSYALYNYARIDKNGPIQFDNLKLIRNFSGMESESGFILVHVAMVAWSGQLVEHIDDSFHAISTNWRKGFQDSMSKLLETMNSINMEMERMWKKSKPTDYMSFRTFIMGTKNQDKMFPNGVIYEGVSEEPMFYRGESGANDSIIPTMDNFLMLTDQMPKNPMTEILKDFRSYRPADHTRWLQHVEESANLFDVRTFALKEPTTAVLYIELLDQVRRFRSRHWNFAKEYIIKRTNYPTATGGSPMAKWLPNQLKVVLDAMKECCCSEFEKGNRPRELERIYHMTELQLFNLQKDLDAISNGEGRNVPVERESVFAQEA